MRQIQNQKPFANRQLAWRQLFVFAFLISIFAPLTANAFTPLTTNSAHFQNQKIAVSGARVYDPQSGRFLSTDPLGHGSSLSLYDYANGDPVNELDPDGRFGKNPGASAASYSTLGYGSQAEMDYANARIAGMSGYDLQEMTYGAPTAGAVLRAAVSLVANVAVSPVTSAGMDISEAAFGVGAGNMPVSGWARLGAGASLALDVLPIIDEAKLGTTALRGGVEGLDAADAGVGAARATPTGQFYSTAFETTLSPTSYPSVTRYMHFKEANIALDAAMEANPALAKLGISVPKSSTGSILGKSPENWVWHHDTQAGIMQLVPKSQHPNIPGGIFWDTMHPGGDGGFSIWGK